MLKNKQISMSFTLQKPWRQSTLCSLQGEIPLKLKSVSWWSGILVILVEEVGPKLFNHHLLFVQLIYCTCSSLQILAHSSSAKESCETASWRGCDWCPDPCWAKCLKMSPRVVSVSLTGFLQANPFRRENPLLPKWSMMNVTLECTIISQ